MKNIILKFIKVYQFYFSRIFSSIFSPGLGGCRFYPSCSEYSYESIDKFGVVKGISKSAYRILRCNPLSKGGIDYI